MMEKKFEKLLEPMQLGSLLIKNRMIMAAMWSRFVAVTGEVTPQLIDYYAERAKSGPGFITIEAAAVDGRHVWTEAQLRVDDDKFMTGLFKLLYAIRINGVPAILQLHNAGTFGTNPTSPSGLQSFRRGIAAPFQPKALTIEEVEEVIDKFIEAAVRAKAVGFDGVELHGATAYLLQQWVSPHYNRRTDRYGGSFENRIAMPLEIVRGIRRRCGADFPIGYALMADELLPDGTKPDETKAFAQALEREGVDYVTVMIGTYETVCYEECRGMCLRQQTGVFDYSEDIKKAVGNMKVLARSHGAHEPLMWEEALKKGQVDGVTLGRQLLADAETPRKVAEGRLDDIRQCVRCGCCTSAVERVICTVNPDLGMERDYAIKRTSNPKRVLVFGGGPGGLEASRVAALSGHEVTLMEKQAELGGNLRIASLPIGKEILKSYFLDWEERQCQKAGVKLELGREVTQQVIREVKPDAVIVATGATPLLPQIPGIDKPHVVLAQDVLTGKAKVGKKVVVIGGNEVGIETADFIAEKGLAESVTVIEMLPEIASTMYTVNRVNMLTVWLPKYGIKTYTSMRINEVTDESVTAVDEKGKKHYFEVDTVVVATGYTSNNTMYEQLQDEVSELYAIGDCVKPRQILDAVHEGAYIARQI